MPPHIVYLHGYASSPASGKARDLRDRLAARGLSLTVPDLNAPDFEHLTLTAMLERVAESVRGLPPGPVALVGSSMGGATALHFTDRYRDAEGARVTRLVLLAPAFEFWENRKRQLGEEGLRRWQATGWLETYHYGYGETRRVHWGLMEDLRRYDSYSVSLDVPILIVHGRRDESVDFRQSVRFAEARPNVDLRLVDSDHQLLDQTETIWQALVTFLSL